jgi:hypothetical protein
VFAGTVQFEMVAVFGPYTVTNGPGIALPSSKLPLVIRFANPGTTRMLNIKLAIFQLRIASV